MQWGVCVWRGGGVGQVSCGFELEKHAHTLIPRACQFDAVANRTFPCMSFSPYFPPRKGRVRICTHSTQD